MSAKYTAANAIVDIYDCGNSQAVIACFRRFILQYHIDTFTCGEIDLANRKRVVFHAMEWPDRWRNYYFQSGMVDHDPLLGALDQEAGAFTWTELRGRRALSVAGTDALTKVAAEGWTDGLVVPLRRTGSHYGLVSLVVNEHYLDKHQKTDLTGGSLVFHDRMRHHVPRDGFPLPPAAAMICSRCGFYETDTADADATYDLGGGKDTLSIQGITKPVTFDGTHIFIDGQDAGTVTGYELLKFYGSNDATTMNGTMAMMRSTWAPAMTHRQRRQG